MTNPFGDSKFTDRNWTILDALRSVAEQVGRPMAEVALAWVLGRPGVGSLLIGASRPEQLDGNLAALGLVLPADQLRVLNEASALPPAFPYAGFQPAMKRSIFGGTDVEVWR